MKFAYADPPYLGCGAKFYGFPEWDKPERHHLLIKDLCRDFPDGWALSLHSPSLRLLLPMCPPDVRVAAWVKPFACGNPGVRVSYRWEPVLWRGGRRGYDSDIIEKDWLSCNPIKFSETESGLIGQKPRAFCRWIFGLFGAEKGDEFIDLFPGSFAVSTAWAEWVGEQSPLPQLPLYGGSLAQ